MATIITEPELRKTQDNMALTKMWIEIDNLQPNESPYNLTAIAWGNLANEVKDNFAQNDRVILEGRLSMNLLDRQGYKEKVAELVISHIYHLDARSTNSSQEQQQTITSNNNSDLPQEDLNTFPSEPEKVALSSSSFIDKNLDVIPFVRSIDSKIAEDGLLDSYEVYSQCPEVGVTHNFKFL
jgi:single-stranded DNA-binding protein